MAMAMTVSAVSTYPERRHEDEDTGSHNSCGVPDDQSKREDRLGFSGLADQSGMSPTTPFSLSKGSRHAQINQLRMAKASVSVNPLTQRRLMVEESFSVREPRPETTPQHVIDDQIQRLTISQKIHAIFEAEGFGESLFAERYKVVTMGTFGLTLLLIVTSVMIFTVESLPEYYGRNLFVFFVLESICIGWFSFEMVVRFVTATEKKRFLNDILNWVDLIAVIPFYVEVGIQIFVDSDANGTSSFIVLRVVRLARMFRVFKLSKYSEGIQVVGIALRRSSDALSLLLFLTTITVVIFGSAIFFAESMAADFVQENRTWVRKPGYGGPESKHDFVSIPHSFWWCLVTITTVGYGDMTPVTTMGYLVGACAMMAGILIAAFPIIILGANFSDARESQMRKKEEERLLRLEHLEEAEALSPRHSATEVPQEVSEVSLSEGAGAAGAPGARTSLNRLSQEPSRSVLGYSSAVRRLSADRMAGLDSRDLLLLLMTRIETLDRSVSELRAELHHVRVSPPTPKVEEKADVPCSSSPARPGTQTLNPPTKSVPISTSQSA
eukprot:TRINITY_DN74002_c0_g1_i1.p1 TRINITY_DN74002_c0_g1~~TRINITY_DN74002_c0_g1_i1.p1  ORF type:complete len:553 (+),score=83.89 TRINITY_DN74002_c0_g1_i1:183-1841(+)